MPSPRSRRHPLATLTAAFLLLACGSSDELPSGGGGGAAPEGGASPMGGMGGTGGSEQGGSDPTGGGGAAPTELCPPNATESCFEGPPEHAGVGACVMGSRSCVLSGNVWDWGPCTGYGIASDEMCNNGIDENCSGEADEGCPCPEGATESCYTGPAGTMGVGECHAGTRTCSGGTWGPCYGQATPMSESCDGKDNDCDADPNEENTVCSGACTTQGPAACETFDVGLTTPPVVPNDTGCQVDLSTAPACDVPAPGPQYYLDPAVGDDSNPGTSAAAPFASLCHALAAVPDGATLNVAQGQYGIRGLHLARSLTLKGGWQSGFASWDPAQYPSVLHGQVSLEHDDAVVGGFDLIATSPPFASSGSTVVYHRVRAGKLIRNRVVIDHVNASKFYFTAVDMSACAGQQVEVACNSIYVRAGLAVGSLSTYSVLSSHYTEGAITIRNNRICGDSSTSALSGRVFYALNNCNATTAPATLTLTNNILDGQMTGVASDAVQLGSCGTQGLEAIATNNTIASGRSALKCSTNMAAPSLYRLTNNILWGRSSGSEPAIEPTGSPVLHVVGNLMVSWSSSSVGSWTTNTGNASASSPATVFVGAAPGYFAPLAAGPAIGTATNVYADPTYGDVTTDLELAPRPPIGPWDRGALLPAP